MFSIVLQEIILGTVQGITEWLPISSEGMIVLIQNNFFSALSLQALVKLALFLHLGTFLAALIYFREDVWRLTKTIFNYKKTDIETKKIFNFLLISTIFTGIVGLGLFSILEIIENKFSVTGKAVNSLVGVMLLITGFLQTDKKKRGVKNAVDVNWKDSILVGLSQGLAIIPGISRSGITVSALLLRKFNDTDALKLSFLMSLPAVLAGNIILNFGNFSLTGGMLLGLLFSFLFGLLTIHLLLRLSKRVNFAYFVILFGLLMIATIFV